VGSFLRIRRAIVLQSCEHYMWRGQKKDDGLVQESFGVNKSLVQARSHRALS